MLLSVTCVAQVGVGTTTPSSTLDVTALNATGTSTNVDGLLIPRVNRQRARLMSGIPTSTLIYVNAINSTKTGQAINIDTIGFYYFDGSVWQKLIMANNDWSLTGNTGTTAGTNFLGTTDSQDLVLKTNNTEKVRVKTDGKVGIGEVNPSDATLEVKGKAIIGNTFTGGNAVAQTGGLTVEGRTIIGEDDFYYSIDKTVVYGNTNWIPTAVTNGDNGNGLTYAINGYTSDGVCVYGEDNDGGTAIEGSVDGPSTNRPIGVRGFDTGGNGTGVRGISQNPGNTAGFIGVHGVEANLTGWAVLGSGDIGSTTNGFLNASDIRLKKNIKPIENALAKIKQIEPKTYEMRWDEEKYKNVGFDKTPQMGFIAQELEIVLPNTVKEKTIPLKSNNYTKEQIAKNPKLAKEQDATMEIKMVNYIQLIPLLTQAIKEQQEIIEAQNKRIEKLESLIN